MIARIITQNNQPMMFQDTGNPDFSTVERLLTENGPELFGGEVISIPSITIYGNRGYHSTYRNDKGCSTNYRKYKENDFFDESVISGEVASEDRVLMSELIVKLPDDTEKTMKYGLDMFEEGFVLQTGKTASGIFGGISELYLSKITSKQIKSISRENAKHFKNLSDVLKYIRKNESVFRFTVKEYGYQWSYEFASEVFEKMLLEGMTARKRKSFEETSKELAALLNSINQTEATEPLSLIHI